MPVQGSRAILLRGARQLVTMRGDHAGPRRGAEMRSIGIIPEGAMLISGGLIREVGTCRRVERLAEARNAEVIDVSGKVVLPGFIDCLTRLLHPVGAELLEDRAPSEGAARPALHSSAMLKAPSAQRLESDAARRLRQLARQGTLLAAASPGWDDDDRAALKALRVLANLTGVVRLAPALAVRGEDSAELLQRVHRLRLASAVSIDAHSPSARGLIAQARQLGLRLRIHGDPCLAAECNAQLVGGAFEWTTPRIAAMRSANTVWAALPVVDWMRGTRPAPLRDRIDDGLAIALSTGYGLNGSATTSMAAVMSLACIGLRMTPAEALTAVTINAAHALGMARETGSLSPGKRADFVVFDTADYREPAMHLGTNLICGYMAGGVWYAPRRPVQPAAASVPTAISLPPPRAQAS